MNYKSALLIITGLSLTACASSSVSTFPETNRVMLSATPAPDDCIFVGKVNAREENFITGPWTFPKDMEEDTFYKLEDNAVALNANFVHLDPITQSNWVMSNGRPAAFSLSGKAFQCSTLPQQSAEQNQYIKVKLNSSMSINR